MRCPACFHFLYPLLYKGIEVDFCIDCGGTFFDRGELQEYLGEFLSIPSKMSQEVELDGQMISLGHSAKTRGQCPKCQENLFPFRYTYAPEIVFDSCGSCCAIWADGGEVQRLSEAMETYLEPFQTKERKKTSSLKACGDLSTSALDAPWIMQRQSFLLGLLPQVIPPISYSKVSKAFFPWVTFTLLFVHFFLILFGLAGRFFSLPISLFPLAGITEFNLVVNLFFLGALGGVLERRATHLGFGLFLGGLLCFSAGFFGLFQGTPWELSYGISALGPGCLGGYLLLYPFDKFRFLLCHQGVYRIFQGSLFWVFVLWGVVASLEVLTLHQGLAPALLPSLVGFIGGAVFCMILKIFLLERWEVQEFGCS